LLRLLLLRRHTIVIRRPCPTTLAASTAEHQWSSKGIDARNGLVFLPRRSEPNKTKTTAIDGHRMLPCHSSIHGRDDWARVQFLAQPHHLGRECTDGDTNTKHCLLSLARRANHSRWVCEKPRVCALAEHVLLRTTTGPVLCKPAASVVSALASVLSGIDFIVFGCQSVFAHVLNGLQLAVTERNQESCNMAKVLWLDNEHLCYAVWFRKQVLVSRIGEHPCCKFGFQTIYVQRVLCAGLNQTMRCVRIPAWLSTTRLS